LRDEKCREELLTFVNWLIQAEELDSSRLQLEPDNPEQENASINLFDVLVGISEERPNLPESPHYGALEFNRDKSRVILKNTAAECLWLPFAPRTAAEAEPRYFLMNSLRKWLISGARKEFHILSKLFLDYCLLQGRDIHVPFDRTTSSAHQAAGV
ncbi:MAG: hypothetical protein D6681_18285, partial [Calditrichaeota bacterium]